MSRALRVKMPEFKASVTALERALQGDLAASKYELIEAARKTAADAAEDLADRTFPKGYGFFLAKSAIKHELTRLYATGGQVFESLKAAGERAIAVEFYHAYKSRNMGAATRILQRSSTYWRSVPVGNLNPALHEQSRNKSTGHIEVTRPKQIVPAEDLKFYTAIAIRRLGKTASGWLACAKQLGGNGSRPKWKGTAMHGSEGGHVDIRHTATGVTIVLINSRPLARKHISPGQINNVMRKARRNMTDRLIKGGIMKRGKLAA